MKLYKFNKYLSSRLGSLEGLFIADKHYMEATIKDRMALNLGEISVMNNDLDFFLEPKDIQEVKISDNAVNELIEALGHRISGNSPFDYIEK